MESSSEPGGTPTASIELHPRAIFVILAQAGVAFRPPRVSGERGFMPFFLDSPPTQGMTDRGGL